VAVALVIGVAVGAAGGSSDRSARRDAQGQLATAKSEVQALRAKEGADRAALDAALRATTTTAAPVTTMAPTTTRVTTGIIATTPAPTTTTAPPPPPTTGPKTSFGNGQYRVAVDVAPGTYLAPGGSLCYWERQATFGGGGSSDIIANDLSSGGQVVVSISASDKGFKTSGCGTWTPG